MLKDKIKFNIFDILIVAFVVLFVGLILLAWFWPKKELSGVAVLGLRVTENARIVKPAVKVGETVYLNGSNNPSRITAVSGDADSVLISIKGPAEKSNESYNFNGQRVLISQKAELHGSFFARALVESFNYEK